jgi:predicted nucleic acid-binding protein
VITSPVFADTGPLVAILRESDQYHDVCVEQVKSFANRMLTCWPVITEAAWLLRDSRPLFRMLDSGRLECLELDSGAAKWMDQYAERYASLNPQLADLAVVYLAEREGIDHIFTLDRRDFTVYRRSNGQPFHLLPESLG